jgi:hypothetical protein
VPDRAMARTKLRRRTLASGVPMRSHRFHTAITQRRDDIEGGFLAGWSGIVIASAPWM